MFERHQKIALQLSGGKDSLACLYLMRPHLDRLTVYYLNAGDETPENLAIIEQCKAWIPHFVEVKTDAREWISRHGYPSDVVPTGSTALGTLMGFGDLKLSDRFACCWANVMQPMYVRMKADGITLIIRGQKLVDMPKVPLKSGDVMDGFEFYYPIEKWSHAEVFQYLKSVGAPINDSYRVTKDGLGCMHCTAWWENRSVDWLKEKHPDAFEFVSGKHKAIRIAVAAQMEALHA